MTFLDIARTDRKHLDFKSFPFSHHITHDHINLGVIKEVIRDLPPFNISYTTDSQEIQADFEAILTDKSKLLDAETMTQNLMTTKSYIALSNVERHPLLKNLCDNIISEIKKNYVGSIKGMNFWLFVASPGAVTPFHFDRFSNFLFQIRGSKELAVFPHFHKSVLSPEDCEKYCDGIVVKSPWHEEMDQLASKYHLTEGVGVHIPFTGAHYVKNGSQDISITISVFFHSPRTIIWSRAMRFNNSFKSLFSRVGIKLKEVRPHLKRNYLKAYLLPLKKFIAK